MVNKVVEDSAGSYNCEAINAAGRAESDSVELVINKEIPYMVENPRSTVEDFNSSVTLVYVCV